MLTRFIPYLRLVPAALIGVLALIAVIQWAEARHWQKRYTASEKAHTATKTAYTGAQRVAAELNKAKVERIEREYETIAQRTESEYETHLANNRRAVADFMRRQAAKSSASGGGTGQAAPVSSQAMPDPAQAQFLVSGTDLEIAADNYSQLVALIEWAESVGKVE